MCTGANLSTSCHTLGAMKQGGVLIVQPNNADWVCCVIISSAVVRHQQSRPPTGPASNPQACTLHQPSIGDRCTARKFSITLVNGLAKVGILLARLNFCAFDCRLDAAKTRQPQRYKFMHVLILGGQDAVSGVNNNSGKRRVI